LPEGIAGPPVSWGAWQTDPVVASTKENKLYWKGGSQVYNTQDIYGMVVYQYNIDNNTVDTVLDITNMPKPTGVGSPWSMYGTSIGIHPETGELFLAIGTYAISGSNSDRNNWKVIKVNQKGGKPKVTANSQGNIISEYPLRQYYWFPAMPIFPDNHPPHFTSVPLPTNVTLNDSHHTEAIYLKDKVTDMDNMDAAIVFSVSGYDKALVNVLISNNQLIITPRKTITQGQTSETTNVTLTANSNGKTIQHHFNVTLEAGTKGDDEHEDGNSNFDPINNPFELTLHTLQLYTGQQAQLALTAPQHFITKWTSDDKTIANVNQYGTITTHHTGQVYIIAQDSTTGKYDQCLLIISDLPNYQDQTNPVVQINNSELRLAKGQTTQLKIVAAHHLNTTTNWQTTNHHVADVTDNGTVIAVNPGYATITLKTSDGAQTHCYVYVTPPVTQPIVYDLKTDQVTLDFPKLARANNYLLHLYLIKFNKGTPGLTPVYTLKVNQYGGLVNTKAPQGNILTAKLDKLLPFNSYIVWIETIITDSVENTQILATESVAFTTLKTTDIQQVDNEQAKVLYHNGILTLINMQESNVIAVNTQGNVVLNVDVTQIIQLVHAKLKTGVYILQQKKKNQSKIYKIFVR
jgi:HSP20 family molecular chaperone IbpA